MARDLIKFFDDQKKSFTRYVSSVDSLLEKYEDVIEDEMQSVVDLSTNQIYKGKETLFLNEKEFDSVCDQSLIMNKDKDSSMLVSMKITERSINTDFLEDTDTRGYVEKFLGEDEPDPSEGETLSSESTCSYITVYSDYEEDPVHDDELDQDGNNDVGYTDNADQDEVDGTISRTRADDTRLTQTDYSKNSLPDTGRTQTHEDVNKGQRNRIDETYLIVEDTDLNENNCARTYTNKFVPELDKTCLQSYGSSLSDSNGIKMNNNGNKRSSEKKNVKRITTIFTPFSDSKLDTVNRNVSNKNLVCNNNNKIESRSGGLEDEHSLSPKDRWCFKSLVKERKDKQNKVKLSCNDSDVKELINDTYTDSPRNHVKNFSPKRTSEQFTSSVNDLSLSFRVKGSPQLLKRSMKAPGWRPTTEENYMFNAKCNVQKLNSPLNQRCSNAQDESSGIDERFRQKTNGDIHKLNTPLHHRQARGMFISKWQSSALPNDNSSCNVNETELESFNDDNISSRKDSGFGTLNEDSLTVDTPVTEEIPEILSLENLDSFNKSLANQSAFMNVSGNCPGPRKEETVATVEKWLQDTYKEMKNVCETSLDRKVNRLSQEVRKDIKDCKTDDVPKKRKSKNIRQRHSNSEQFEGNALCSPPKLIMSGQSLQESQRSDMYCGRQTDFITQERQRELKGGRHFMKGHRNLSQEIFQRLKDEQVVEMMKNCDNGENGKATNAEVNKQRHSEFSGKRFMDHSDDMVDIGDTSDVLPTPPKSRRLNENNNNQLRDRHDSKCSFNRINGDKCGRFSGGENNIVDRYIKNDKKSMFQENDKQEMLACMLHRDSSKKPPNKKLEFQQVRRSGNGLSCSERNGNDYQYTERYFYHEKEDTNSENPQNLDNSQVRKKSPVTRGLQNSPDKRLQRSFDVGCQKSPKTRSQRSPKTRIQEQCETYWPKSPETRVNENSDKEWQKNPDTIIPENSVRVFQRGSGTKIQRNLETLWQTSPETRISRNLKPGVHRNYRDSEIRHHRRNILQGNSETEWLRSPEARIQRNSEPECQRRPYNIQRQRNERESRMQNVYVSPGHQYKVSHSYIRKLNGKSELEDTDDNVCDQDYDRNDNHIERVYEGNANDYHNVLESSPSARNRQSIIQAKYGGGGKLLEENEYELNERKNVNYKKSERNRREQYRDVKHCHSPDAIYTGFSRGNNMMTDSGHYIYGDVEKDDEMYHQQSRSYGDNCQSIRSGGKTSEQSCSRNNWGVLDSQSERSNERSENVFDKQMYFYENGKNVENFRKQHLSSRSQGSRNFEHFGNSGVHRLEHFTGEGIENRSPHQERDSNVVSVESKSSKSVRRQSPHEKHNDFRSSSVQRTRASIKEDAFSPSTSLAKMRLNTPESRSKDRSRQRRRNYSGENEIDQNVSHLQTLDYDFHVSSLERSAYDIEEERYSQFSDTANDFSEKTPCTEIQSSPKFVSLDQIQGMPLQFRIQQLGAKHSNEKDGLGKNPFRNKECSNQYICEKSDDTSEKFENKQDNAITERSINSNIYHKYYNVINKNEQEREPSLCEGNFQVNRNENTSDCSGQQYKTVPIEQKIKKSLFAPINENKKQSAISLKSLQSGITFDAFKIPMTPPIVAKGKPIQQSNQQNKENLCAENKMCHENTKCASVSRDHITIKPPRTRIEDISSLRYLQSTPIKPGSAFLLNTTMSTIVGSEDTPVSYD